MSLTNCGPLLSGTCFIEASAGQLICNETGGFTIKGPDGQCDFFSCGYDYYLQNGTEPVNRNGTVCMQGQYFSDAKRERVWGLLIVAIVGFAFLPVLLQCAPLGLP